MHRFSIEAMTHPRLARRLARGVSLDVSFLGSADGGRRAIAHVRGPARTRVRVARRILPGLARVDTPGATVCDRLQGVVPTVPDGPSLTGRREMGLWPALVRAERALFGVSGCLLATTISPEHLALSGLNVEPARPDELTAHASLVLEEAALAAPGGVAAHVRPWGGPGGAPEGPERLKPIEVETARIALELGYYDQPRRTTMQGIADALGITKSAVYHRINGLERKAVERLFGGAGRT